MMSGNKFKRHPVIMNRIRWQAIEESDMLPGVLATVVAGFIGHYSGEIASMWC